jgi:hypothetical protein
VLRAQHLTTTITCGGHLRGAGPVLTMLEWPP